MPERRCRSGPLIHAAPFHIRAGANAAKRGRRLGNGTRGGFDVCRGCSARGTRLMWRGQSSLTPSSALRLTTAARVCNGPQPARENMTDSAVAPLRSSPREPTEARHVGRRPQAPGCGAESNVGPWSALERRRQRRRSRPSGSCLRSECGAWWRTSRRRAAKAAKMKAATDHHRPKALRLRGCLD
jgi:hypothetical protein